jgi:hypothetical protein
LDEVRSEKNLRDGSHRCLWKKVPWRSSAGIFDHLQRRPVLMQQRRPVCPLVLLAAASTRSLHTSGGQKQRGPRSRYEKMPQEKNKDSKEQLQHKMYESQYVKGCLEGGRKNQVRFEKARRAEHATRI